MKLLVWYSFQTSRWNSMWWLVPVFPCWRINQTLAARLKFMAVSLIRH